MWNLVLWVDNFCLLCVCVCVCVCVCGDYAQNCVIELAQELGELQVLSLAEGHNDWLRLTVSVLNRIPGICLTTGNSQKTSGERCNVNQYSLLSVSLDWRDNFRWRLEISITVANCNVWLPFFCGELQAISCRRHCYFCVELLHLVVKKTSLILPQNFWYLTVENLAPFLSN